MEKQKLSKFPICWGEKPIQSSFLPGACDSVQLHVEGRREGLPTVRAEPGEGGGGGGGVLHLGAEGENGPVVADLLGNLIAPTPAAERFFLAEIRTDDLVGPLSDFPLDELAGRINAGEVYLNLHTSAFPSGELRKVHARCRATIGEVGNADYQNVRWGKAGRKRHKGRRPHNRGTSMNPVAHPMGGGEGRTGGGRHPVTPWGRPTKGGKTRKRKAASNQFILRRRKPGKHSGGK